jgi:hypothetical protein
MFDVVLFSDTSITDSPADPEQNLKGNISYSMPAKGAGVYRLATEVRRHGYSCQIVNLCFQFTEAEIRELCSKFISKSTLVVGFSTTFWYMTPNDSRISILVEILKETRKLNGPKIVIGGSVAANFGEKIKADTVFLGFSDNIFIKYLQSLKTETSINYDTISESGAKIVNSDKYQSNFDFNSSYIQYETNDFVDYGESKVIELARGCIFRCNFCAYPLNGKRKFDYIKNFDVLKNELITNYERFGISNYTLSDDTFNDSTYKIEHLHKLFTSLPFKIKFVSYLRLDLLNSHREQIGLLKDMGLVGAFFGIETLNHASAKVIGKGMHPEKVKDLLYELKAVHWKNDVNITIGLMSGLPYETKESHNSTVKWILDKDSCTVDRVVPSGLTIFNPLLDRSIYKSEFQINAAKYGYYWPNKESNEWKNHSHNIKTNREAAEMAKELYDAAKEVHKVTKDSFNLMLYHNIAKYDNTPKTIENLIEMDIKKFSEWAYENRQSMISKYISNYKTQILNSPTV